MKSFLTRGGPVLALFAAFALIVVGCGQSSSTDGQAKDKDPGKDRAVAKADGDKKDPGKAEEKGGHDHSGWWCDEHGLPEHVCDLCSKKFREAEKAKGNWCEHNRVKSSCFKCNPGLREKYAAEYKAKFGKEPPPTEDDEKDEKKDKK